jgi:long-chain fatty acid transport protein
MVTCLRKWFLFLTIGYTGVLAGGFQLNEHGARGIGMGGAYVARPFDGSAIFINPAGLPFAPRLEYYGGATAIAPRVRFRGAMPENPVPETYLKSRIFFPPHSFLTVSTGTFGFGVGVYTMFGLGTEWPRAWAGRAISEKANLVSFTINPSVGIRLTEYLAVGMGWSYIPANVEIIRTIKTPFSSEDGKPVEPRARMSATGRGSGWNVGALLQLSDIAVGLSYRSASRISFSGDVVFQDVPSSLKSNFQNSSIKTRITTPANIIVGIAYKLTPSLSAGFDFQYSTWSNFDTLTVELEKPLSGQNVIRSTRDYQDAFLLRMGIEYDWSEELTLRLGYIFDKNPVKDGFLEPSLPDADRHDITVGLGYSLTENVRLDVAYMRVIALQRSERGSIPEFSFNGTYNSSAHLLSISARYRIL